MRRLSGAFYALSLVVLSAAPAFTPQEALAQGGSRTRCRAFGGELRCDTSPDPLSMLPPRQPRVHAPGECAEKNALFLGCTLLEIKTAKKYVADQQASGAQQQQIGGLIADGKCEEAKALALRVGDLALAGQVAQLCAPAVPAQPAAPAA